MSWRSVSAYLWPRRRNPFGEGVAVMKVGGKVFRLVPLSAAPSSVNLKCKSKRALELREGYAGIRPGYHQNKRHWNTVDLDGSVENDVVRGLIHDSYDLVVARVPHAARAEPWAGVAGCGGRISPPARNGVLVP